MASQDQLPSRAGELSHQQRFFHYFQQEITALQEQMARLADTALIGGERSDATDHCLAGITRLSAEVKDASGYLPAYDQRTYAEAIKALQEKLEESKKAFAPKPKFSFKSTHKGPSSLSLSDAAELAAEKRRDVPGYLSPDFQNTPNSSSPNTPGYGSTPPNEKSTAQDERPPSSSERLHGVQEAARTEASRERPSLCNTATSVSIANQSNTHIILPSSGPHSQTPCALQHLNSCVVDLSVPSTTTSPFASLTINSVSSSLLVCGAVSGPAHITGVKNSVLVLKARQFRMHECENVDVYLHCTSRPIIEDCKGIRFAVLPKFYSDLLSASQAATGKEPPNQWNQVDDFKWIKSEPSPNWSVLPAAANIPDETWREVVPGGPGWNVSQILKAAGIGGPA